jgi:hypothetical protein
MVLYDGFYEEAYGGGLIGYDIINQDIRGDKSISPLPTLQI